MYILNNRNGANSHVKSVLFVNIRKRKYGDLNKN